MIYLEKECDLKKWAKNNFEDIPYFEAKDENGIVNSYPMDTWLKLVGIFISDGYIRNKDIVLCAYKQRKKIYNEQIYKDLGVEYTMKNDRSYILGSKHLGILNEMKKLNLGAVNKTLPNYVWNLSERQSRILLDALIEGDGSRESRVRRRYHTTSIKLANDIVRLCLHCGWSGNTTIDKKAGNVAAINTPRFTGTITAKHDLYRISIVSRSNNPEINHPRTNYQEEKYVDYTGRVYCLEIPDTHQHVYYSRENNLSPAIWTGNSARSGQKGLNYT